MNLGIEGPKENVKKSPFDNCMWLEAVVVANVPAILYFARGQTYEQATVNAAWPQDEHCHPDVCTNVVMHYVEVENH